MKKLFLIGAIISALLTNLFVTAMAHTNEVDIYTENNRVDDGWENIGEVAAEVRGGVDGIYYTIIRSYQGTLYVKIIATKVLYKFVRLGKEYSVSNMSKDRWGNCTGTITINNDICVISLPFIDV